MERRAVLSIPYERNPLFIGRESIIEELNTFFASDLSIPLRIAALIGMPGVGKTQIALEYVYHMQHKYQAVVWLDAPSRHQLAENISNALRMGCSWRTDAERNQIFAAFRTWLWGYQSSFLLVVDQIGDYSLLNDLLDEDMTGHVLMTHASRNAMDEWKSVIVEPFHEQEGSLFLLRRAGLLASQELKDASRATRQAAEALHKEVGGHPLALDQAGAYIKETGCRIDEYLARYRKNPRALLDRRDTASSYPFSAYQSIAAMHQGAAHGAQELLFLYVRNSARLLISLPPLALEVSGVFSLARGRVRLLYADNHAARIDLQFRAGPSQWWQDVGHISLGADSDEQGFWPMRRSKIDRTVPRTMSMSHLMRQASFRCSSKLVK